MKSPITSKLLDSYLPPAQKEFGEDERAARHRPSGRVAVVAEFKDYLWPPLEVVHPVSIKVRVLVGFFWLKKVKFKLHRCGSGSKKFEIVDFGVI